MTPRAALVRGALAGLLGTAVMTVSQELSARLWSSGDEHTGDEGQAGNEGQSGDGQSEWEQASPPAQAGKRIIEGVTGKQVGPERIPALTHGVHWAYGTGWGVVFGILQADRGGSTLRRGLGFGVAVWTASYAQLVPMGLYEPPWNYEPGELAMELFYHLAYGAGVGAGWALVGD